MCKVVQLEKYFDFYLYSHHFSLLSLTSLLSAPEREVTSPSDFKVVGALVSEIMYNIIKIWVHKTSLIHHFLLKCLCQARRVSGCVHVSSQESEWLCAHAKPGE